jgi:hypothetical protein
MYYNVAATEYRSGKSLRKLILSFGLRCYRFRRVVADNIIRIRPASAGLFYEAHSLRSLGCCGNGGLLKCFYFILEPNDGARIRV